MSQGPVSKLRIGVDLGGTKIAGILLGPGSTAAQERIPAPRGDYDATIKSIAELVDRLKALAGDAVSVGVGVPGSVSPATGVMQNANSTWLNGRPLVQDLTVALGQVVRVANDANCFALSEAIDGAGAGAGSVFGVILGTGAGGGLVFDGRILDGPRGIAGEWGHNPLPWARESEHPGPVCWCGRASCMEAWVSGPGLARDHTRASGRQVAAEDVVRFAESGDAAAMDTLARHTSRLARGLAHVVNILDPEVIVLGGGLSKMAHLYADLPGAMAPYIFADTKLVDVRPPKWGDASGVRGAAWLWD